MFIEISFQSLPQEVGPRSIHLLFQIKESLDLLGQQSGLVHSLSSFSARMVYHTVTMIIRKPCASATFTSETLRHERGLYPNCPCSDNTPTNNRVRATNTSLSTGWAHGQVSTRSPMRNRITCQGPYPGVLTGAVVSYWPRRHGANPSVSSALARAVGVLSDPGCPDKRMANNTPSPLVRRHTAGIDTASAAR